MATTEADTVDDVPKQAGYHLGSFSSILLAAILGVACGLFFGEYCRNLGIVGNAYIGLLQMTVLPYIVFSLVGNIGRLSISESKRLAKVSVMALAILWLVGALVVLVIPFALPDWETGSFFSTSLINPVKEVDFLALFIPSNPFQSLAQNLAPAVVLFCMFFGFALIKIRDKEQILGLVDTITATLSRVSHLIANLAPIGIFAISASATGTLTLEEFGRLQAYLLIFTAAVLIVMLWALPMLVACLTPFKYRDIVAASRSALITTFVIGSVFVVIPMLVDSVRELLDKYHKEQGYEDEDLHALSNPEFIIPLAYPFPHLGKVLTLIFVPFAAWFYGRPMEFVDYPLFLSTGLLLSFGKVTTTIPFLLDMQELPADIFQLFLMSSVVAGRFNDVLGAMHLMAFTLLVTAAMAGIAKVQRTKLIFATASTVIMIFVAVVGMRVGLNATFTTTFGRDTIIASMNSLERQVSNRVLSFGVPEHVEDEGSRLERIRQSETLRVGFDPDRLPFTYYNARGQLVGLDIDLIHRLARDLHVSEVEFVPFAPATLAQQLADDQFSLAISGLAATVARAENALISAPYMNVTMAIVVRDYDKRAFEDLDELRTRDDLRIGVEIGSYFGEKIREVLPNAKLVELWSERQFFEGPPEYMDALVTSAEGGAGWTLVHPEYTVISPMRRKISVPLAFLIAGKDQELNDFLKQWIELKRLDGTIDDLYDYWILGRGAKVKKPRWSIIRDVLGWVE
ncbi:MAG: cation:dicarboxylate symporter family transporter [Hyphomicrobiales bacterium]